MTSMRNDLVRRLRCEGPYWVGRFILQVVGRVRSAAVSFASSFQPSPVCSASSLALFVNTRLAQRAEQLVVLGAHDVLVAHQVGCLHAFQRQRDLQRVGRAGLVDRRASACGTSSGSRAG